MRMKIIAHPDHFARGTQRSGFVIAHLIFKLYALIANPARACVDADFLIKQDGRFIGNMHIGYDEA